jgi:8-oxo-dGTP pyrophosphatase MutT (NUDIX family)
MASQSRGRYIEGMLPPSSTVALQPFSLDRVFAAAEDVRQRLLRATRTLQDAGVPFAVAGGHAVASWVTRADKAAVRATQDVDLLVRRQDFAAARQALEQAGFHYAEVLNVPVFLDAPDASPRDAIHLVFADEILKPGEEVPTPGVEESEEAEDYRIVNLDALVRMKLTSFRRKDQVHLQDLIQVGLVDQSWLTRVDDRLRDRLQELIDDPYG